MTPAQFAACSRVFDQDMRFLDYEFSALRAIIAEVNRNPKQRNTPFKPEEFMCLEHEGEDKAQDSNVMTPAQQLAYVRNVLYPNLLSHLNKQKQHGGEL